MGFAIAIRGSGFVWECDLEMLDYYRELARWFPTNGPWRPGEREMSTPVAYLIDNLPVLREAKNSDDRMKGGKNKSTKVGPMKLE